MTTIRLTTFAGEIPKTPPHALGDFNSQLAINCDFTRGDLAPVRDGLLVKTMPDNVRGMYTKDGVKFLTWPWQTWAYRGPVVNDSFERVYYMNQNGFFVTTESQATVTGGAPATAWWVGVPQPEAAPILNVIELNTARGESFTASATAWYELDGKHYDEAAVTLTVANPLREYHFTPPTRGEETPAAARLTCSFKLTDANGTQRLKATQMSGVDARQRSDAFPGSVEFWLSPEGVFTLSWGVYETRSYVYTLVNEFGEESAPSPPATIDVTWLQDVAVLCTLASTGSSPGYRPLASGNIYRTFGTTPTYFKIKSSPTSTNSIRIIYRDETFRAADAGKTLASLEWFLPVSGMTGLTALPNGVFAAYKGEVLYFSEPYRPHAWPYSMSFPKPIRGIQMGAQSLVVTTSEGCYQVMGTHPKNMQQQMLPIPQAGKSKNSMALVEGGVAFLSPDGIVYVQGSRASLDLSQQLFTRDTWREQYGAALADMSCGYHDGFLVAASTSAYTVSPTGFMVRLDEAPGTYTRFAIHADAMFYLPTNDSLYYSMGANVYLFRGADPMLAEWTSKDFVLGMPVNFAGLYIRCTGAVNITLKIDGAAWYTFTANTTGYYRLPAGKKGLRWTITLKTYYSVQELTLAESFGELRSV